MADMPSILLRVLGVTLVLIGLSGIAGGIYAIKLVHDYAIEPAATIVRAPIYEISEELEKRRAEIDSSIAGVGTSLNDASNALASAGGKLASASETVDSASKNLTNAASNLKQVSLSNKDAGIYLNAGAAGLKSWASAYDYNGTPLPSKYVFDSAADKITVAATKLEESGNRLETTAKSMENTAASLNSSSSQLRESSQKLHDVGKNLNKTKENFEKLKNPLGGLISNLSSTLKASAEGIEGITGLVSSVKTFAYLLVGYLIVLHLIILGVGIALIIIDVSIFYPASGGE